MSFVIDPDLARRIFDAIAALDQNPRFTANTVARRVGALPLYADLGGAAFVRPDGVVLEVEWDTPSEAEPRVAPDAARRRALGAGVIEYPWLVSLLPERPPDAVDCGVCKGRRRITISDQSRNWVFCGVCDVKGWVLPERA